MITYKHEKYLKQAIESVLNQKTNFDFELIIANDNSPDNSNSIIKEIRNTHVNGFRINYLNNNTNMGMMPNFVNALKKCNGQYIALCEGDDYWIDEYKLQKQVDFLDQNTDYSICYHLAQVEENDLLISDEITLKKNQTTTIKDLSKGNYMHTCTVMYRNKLFKKFPKYFENAPVGDYYLHMLNSRYGKIYCINEIMSVYRVHPESYWSSKEQLERTKIWINFLENIKQNFNYRVQYDIQEQIDKLKGVFVEKSTKKRKKILFKLFVKDIFNFNK